MNDLAATAAAVTVTTTSETVAVTSPVPDYQHPGGAGVLIRGTVSMTPAGTGTTALVIKVRQGTGTSGTQVGPSTTISAGSTPGLDLNGSIEVIDENPSEPLGQYVITVTQTGASGNGTVAEAAIEVIEPTAGP